MQGGCYPARREALRLRPGWTVEVDVWRADFHPWTGARPESDWHGKPVVGPPRRPFAELQILESLEADAWRGGWVYRPGKFLLGWEPRTFAQAPPLVMALYDRLTQRCSGSRGCWDVFCWRDAEVLFVESKWPEDVIRAPQLRWLGAALEAGIPEQGFRLVECTWTEDSDAETKGRIVGMV
jgi:hypothetical protein